MEEIKIHPDYEKNLNWGCKFINNYNEVMTREMQITVREDVKGEKYHFEFSFIILSDHHWYANAVDPNQASEDFHKEFKDTYWSYLQMQRKLDIKNKSKENFKQFDPVR